jgi:hypothetical protein
MAMKNLSNDQQNKCNIPSRKNIVDERFEHNAGVKIHNKDSYSGGSGFYSIKPNAKCPNVNDNMNEPHSGTTKK